MAKHCLTVRFDCSGNLDVEHRASEAFRPPDQGSHASIAEHVRLTAEQAAKLKAVLQPILDADRPRMGDAALDAAAEHRLAERSKRQHQLRLTSETGGK